MTFHQYIPLQIKLVQSFQTLHLYKTNLPSELFLDRKGDFSPVFTENRKSHFHIFPTSRLLELSQTNIFNGKTIDEYYERIDNANDRLSIKRGRGGVDTEFPRVIRKVGQRWGEGTFQVPFQIPEGVQNVINLTNEIGESILGREPSSVHK